MSPPPLISRVLRGSRCVLHPCLDSERRNEGRRGWERDEDSRKIEPVTKTLSERSRTRLSSNPALLPACYRLCYGYSTFTTSETAVPQRLRAHQRSLNGTALRSVRFVRSYRESWMCLFTCDCESVEVFRRISRSLWIKYLDEIYYVRRWSCYEIS